MVVVMMVMVPVRGKRGTGHQRQQKRSENPLLHGNENSTIRAGRGLFHGSGAPAH
jgi:hypothetical protein